MSKLLYIKIAKMIMHDILNTQLQPGSKVKSVREYALEFMVNAKTVQRAFEYLDSLDIFYSVVGEGRYLSQSEDVIATIKFELIDGQVKAFVAEMKSYNLSLADINQIVKENYERDN